MKFHEINVVKIQEWRNMTIKLLHTALSWWRNDYNVVRGTCYAAETESGSAQIVCVPDGLD